jgi:phage terminase large subunit-like protein
VRADTLIGEPFETDGHRVIRFIETFCRNVNGPYAGKLIKLRPWQVELILELYRLDPKTKRRVYRRGLWGLARKNGKTMLGACLALYHLLADNEIGAEVYSVAGDTEQARICFNTAMKMVRMEPELMAVCVIKDAKAEIHHPASNSVYKALSSDYATAEGYNPSFVVFDEVHVQKNSKLWAVMTNGSATRERACVLGITTAGYDLDTLCGRLYRMGQKGTVRGFMFRWFEPRRKDCDWLDENAWTEANPGLGDFQNIEDFRSVAAEAQARAAENEFRRYRLNQWTGSVEAWLQYGAWDKLGPPLHEITPLEDGEEIVLAFDGSFSGDSTAIMACTVNRPIPYLQKMALWEKRDEIDDDTWRVDIAAVEAEIVRLCKIYAVREVACDPYRWQRSMQVLQELGIPIVEYLTTSPARMVRASTIFSDYVRDEMLEHDGDRDVARHIGNAKLKTDYKGPRIVKEYSSSVRHIDLAIAAVVALDRALEPEENNDFVGDIY